MNCCSSFASRARTWMRACCLLPLLCILHLPASAQSPTDSIDALHYSIHIDTIINTSAVKRIHAHTQVRLQAAGSTTVSTIALNLLEMTVDSVQLDGLSTAYTYDDTLLRVPVPGGLALGDTATVEVWYQGRPQQDPAFGGFYFSGSYVYNIGVGFSVDPVNLGRVWFPCHDNFTDRAFYDFHIRAAQGLVAACNGTLQSQATNPDSSVTWHWELRDDIPAYLAGIAVAPYTTVHDHFVSISGDTIPFEIYAVAGDTTGAKTQSSNLKAGVAALEQRFGPYRWERLGYVLVSMPLTGTLGAMEHATNIVYPRFFLTQGQSFETIWAHEAGHGWFGNLVTCESEGEMWLNEGWASYCEYIFEESVHGAQAYKDYFRSTHATVLRRAHIEEGGYLPLSGIPHAHVYGRTVYSKGSTIAHTLRFQMGDSLFFPAIQNYLDTRAFTHSHSDSLERSLEAFSGQDWTPFFDGWVRQGGAPHFAVDSFVVIPSGPSYQVQVHTRQRLRGAGSLTDDVRATLRFVGADREMQDLDVTLGGANDTISTTLTFAPVAVALDPEEHLADATTDNYKDLTNIASVSFPFTWTTVLVDNIADTSWLRVVHHWVAPDGPISPATGLVLSNSRYWSVEGTFPAGFDARATFQYNGSTNASTGLLDHTWLPSVTEDSIVLFYRAHAGEAWRVADGQTLMAGSPADKIGSAMVDSLMRGDYAFGYYNRLVGVDAGQIPSFRAWPNPNGGEFHVAITAPVGRYRLSLLDIQGNTVKLLENDKADLDFDVQDLPAGVYFLRLDADGLDSHVERIVIQK